MNDKLIVGLAQIAPFWLDKTATIEKIVDSIDKAAKEKCNLVCFGESLLPGYPFWLEHTDGARFNDDFQKSMFAYYSEQAINLSRNELQKIQHTCKANQIACYLGLIEKAQDRSKHSLYCTLAYIDNHGEIQSTHRKLMPTYEERLVWSTGDGHGLRTHALEKFTVGGLNCWENWLPLARNALYAQGEDLHIAVWPGGLHNTQEITRFIAMESRGYVVSVSGLLDKNDIPKTLPFYHDIINKLPETLANGASCVAVPDGSWLLEPQIGIEDIFVVEIDHQQVRKERMLLDVNGHYSRPDVLQLHVNRKRQSTTIFED